MTTIEQVLAKYDEMTIEARKLLMDRGEEYSTKSDELKTFKAVAQSIGTTPSIVGLILLSIKYHRIMEQVGKRKIPKDSFRDLINYSVLCELMLENEIGK